LRFKYGIGSLIEDKNAKAANSHALGTDGVDGATPEFFGVKGALSLGLER
jgi:hypothetical protein